MIRCDCQTCARLDRREQWGEAWQGLLFEELPIVKAPTRSERVARLFELAGKLLPRLR